MQGKSTSIIFWFSYSPLTAMPTRFLNMQTTHVKTGRYFNYRPFSGRESNGTLIR